MNLKVGLVGLPNVGKSTIFNALLQKAKAEVANYPFCTIEPNMGIVSIPDERLNEIAKKEGSAKITPAFIEFVDIAGLVKGASKGEGLGNQFLSHIRSVSAIAQILRCFEEEDIVHVEGEVNPLRDAEIIELELILADLQTIERRMEKAVKQAKSDKNALFEIAVLEKAKAHLEEMRILRHSISDFTLEELNFLEKTLFLLTLKPIMYIANIGEEDLVNPQGNKHFRALKAKAEIEGIPIIALCGKVEAELSSLTENEREEFLKAFGLKEPGLYQMIREGFSLLNLITFFTAGPKEARAWTIKRGTTAKEAAGVIHSDIERGFISAEVISFEDYKKAPNFQKAKELGLLRLEGRDYILEDGDIVYFRFNV
jgi:GTP-binding protein YchF